MNDNLRCITAGAHKFVFLVRGSLVLVSISRTFEPVAQINQQLNYMFSQIFRYASVLLHVCAMYGGDLCDIVYCRE